MPDFRPRSRRRTRGAVTAAGMGLAALLSATVGVPAGAAAGIAPPPSVPTSSTSVPASSTTSVPGSSTTSVPGTSTSTTTVPGSTTSTTTPGHVPPVPTAGPPGTTPPGPPPDPGPIDAQVHADLVQLDAVGHVAQAQAVVLADQTSIDVTSAALTRRQAAVAAAESRARGAANGLQAARSHLSLLAVAAYTGETAILPAARGTQARVTAGPSSTARPPGVVAGGPLSTTSGESRLDAEALLGVVFLHEDQLVRGAARQVRTAGSELAHLTAQLAGARHDVDVAEQSLAADRLALASTVHTATTAVVVPTPAAAAPAAAKGARTSRTATTTATTTAATASTTAAARRPAATTPTTPTSPTMVLTTTTGADGSPTILGPSTATAAELAGWFTATGHTTNASVPIAQLAADYLTAGGQTGVRADLAFAQSIIETGYFSFPTGGQLTGGDNNFAGIGACDTCAAGWSFPTALTGVTAQAQLLEAYASPVAVPTPLVGNVGVGGCCRTWVALAGTWASSLAYGVSILTVYHQILGWIIPQRLAAAGLVTATPATSAAMAATSAAAAAIPPATGPATPSTTTSATVAPGVPTATTAPASPTP